MPKVATLGSVRQVLRWFREENFLLPAFPHELGERKMIWKLPGYASLHAMLTNPIYAGAYCYGKTETWTSDGGRSYPQVRGSSQAAKRMEGVDHHPGYFSLGRVRTKSIDDGPPTHSGAEPKAGRGGGALLSGLLRCRRCGRRSVR